MKKTRQTPVEVFYLIALTACFGSFLYWYGRTITGPFIFGDELLYFNLAKFVFNHENLAGFTQYGPLYSVFIAPFFLFKSLVSTYQAIKIFNIVVFLSSIIPAFLLANQLFTNRWLKTLLPFCVIITPFSGLVHIIWAEPLYIALFYWSCFLFYKHFKLPTVMNSCLLGLFLSALYYTKPGAGLAVQIASFLTLIFFFFVKKHSKSWKISLLSIIAIVTCLLIDLPWMLHYVHLNLSIIGYPSASADLSVFVAKEGYWHFLFNVALSFFYQLSYFFVGSWGLIGLTIALLFINWSNLNTTERGIGLFVVLSVLGLAAVSAIGMSAYSCLDYKMVQGRYFSLLLPVIIVFTLHLLLNKSVEKDSSKWMIAVIFITTIMAILASPLYTRNPSSYNSMPDLSAIIFISDQWQLVWRPTIEAPSMVLRVCVPLFFCFFSLGVIFFRKKRYIAIIASIVIAVGSSFAVFAEQYYIVTCGETQALMNSIYSYLIINHIDINQVAFDQKTAAPQEFTSLFWTEKPPMLKTLDEVQMMPNIKFFVTPEPLRLKKIADFNYGFFLYRLHFDAEFSEIHKD